MSSLALVALVGLIAVAMVAMIRWARHGNKAALLAAAALFGLVADPTAEKQIRVIQEARRDAHGEESSGDEPG